MFRVAVTYVTRLKVIADQGAQNSLRPKTRLLRLSLSIALSTMQCHGGYYTRRADLLSLVPQTRILVLPKEDVLHYAALFKTSTMA
ncbi:hypothetical protein TNCV_58891 [Trichonephila clavipes]|nr:hypothetical protein TNCV_58891 [Trichonephila clavipes]